MICVLPVDLAFSTTGFMSHGERNWPFLMLTGLPALQTLRMKSVCRTRNAGVCSTSTTEATSSIGVYSCTSVSTGTSTWRRTSPSTRSPSSMPGPRKLLPDVRLALSKLDLKMKLIPSRAVISFSRPATSSCSCSDSTTQGPAIRKKGWSRPTLNPHRSIGNTSSWALPVGEGLRGTTMPHRNGGSSAPPSRPGPPVQGEARHRAALRLGFLQQLAARLVLARGAHEADEQRVAVARRGQELRVRLAGDEPGMVRQLDHLHQQVVHRLGRDHQAGVLELGPVAVVE